MKRHLRRREEIKLKQPQKITQMVQGIHQNNKVTVQAPVGVLALDIYMRIKLKV